MEEAPESYKNVTDVVDTCHAAGISAKAIKLRPIAVIKGWGRRGLEAPRCFRSRCRRPPRPPLTADAISCPAAGSSSSSSFEKRSFGQHTRPRRGCDPYHGCCVDCPCPFSTHHPLLELLVHLVKTLYYVDYLKMGLLVIKWSGMCRYFLLYSILLLFILSPQTAFGCGLNKLLFVRGFMDELAQYW